MESQQSSNGSSVQTPPRNLAGNKPCCLATPSPVTRHYPEDTEDEAKGWAVAYAAISRPAPLPHSASAPLSLVRAVTSLASLGTCTCSDTAALAVSAWPNPVAEQEVVARSIASRRLGCQPTDDCLGTAPSCVEPGFTSFLTTSAPVPAAHFNSEALLKAIASSRKWQHNYKMQLHVCALPQPPLLMPVPAVSTSRLQPATSVLQTDVAQSLVVWPNAAAVVGAIARSRAWQQQQCQLVSQPQLPYPAHEQKTQALPGTIVPLLQDAIACSRRWLQHQQLPLQGHQQEYVAVIRDCDQHACMHSKVSALGSDIDMEPSAAMLLGSLLDDSKEVAHALSQAPPSSEPDTLHLSSVGTSRSSLCAPVAAVAGVAGLCMMKGTSSIKQFSFAHSWDILNYKLGVGRTVKPPEQQRWVAPVPKPAKSKPIPAAIEIPISASNLAVSSAPKFMVHRNMHVRMCVCKRMQSHAFLCMCVCVLCVCACELA